MIEAGLETRFGGPKSHFSSQQRIVFNPSFQGRGKILGGITDMAWWLAAPNVVHGPAVSTSPREYIQFQCGPGADLTDITWELIKNAASQHILPHSYWISVCILTKSPGNFSIHINVWEALTWIKVS